MNDAAPTPDHPSTFPTGAGAVLWFGGTFDPPTTAHLELPEAARQAVEADSVVYCPAARSPFKSHNPHASGDDRLDMLRAALAHRLGSTAAVSSIELDRAAHRPDQPSYTVDTLAAVRASLPPHRPLRLLIGADQARSFHKWREADRIVQLAEPLVMLRASGPQHAHPDHPDDASWNAARDELLAELDSHWPAHDRHPWARRIVRVPMIHASATRARQLLSLPDPSDEQRRELGRLLPPPVLRLIQQRRLY